jgi:hypothetical protein
VSDGCAASLQGWGMLGARVARWFVFKPKIPILFIFWRALDWKKLVYFVVIWNNLQSIGICILWPFGNVAIIWYIFPHFGTVCQEKSGNPARCAKEKGLLFRQSFSPSADRKGWVSYVGTFSKVATKIYLGPMFWFKNIYAKNWRVSSKFCKNFVRKAIFYAENGRKSPKILIIYDCCINNYSTGVLSR